MCGLFLSRWWRRWSGVIRHFWCRRRRRRRRRRWIHSNCSIRNPTSSRRSLIGLRFLTTLRKGSSRFSSSTWWTPSSAIHSTKIFQPSSGSNPYHPTLFYSFVASPLDFDSLNQSTGCRWRSYSSASIQPPGSNSKRDWLMRMSWQESSLLMGGSLIWKVRFITISFDSNNIYHPFDFAGLKDCIRSGYSYLDGMQELLQALRDDNFEIHAFTNYPIWFFTCFKPVFY